MKHQSKIDWMLKWAHKNNLNLELHGECGFGRECVGVVFEPVGYPDYEWHDDKTCERLDKNGDVWCPPDAYHKHPCVAVLGMGEKAEEQLYRWLKWFEKNGFVVETGMSERKNLDDIHILLGKHMYARMVKKTAEAAK